MIFIYFLTILQILNISLKRIMKCWNELKLYIVLYTHQMLLYIFIMVEFVSWVMPIHFSWDKQP